MPGPAPRALIDRLATGVPGLDEVLGGGLPEFSFTVIAGGPGTGKTTLAQQILFANATPSRPGVCFTALGEPPLAMLRYQQQLGFFDVARVNRDVTFISLDQVVSKRDLGCALATITREVRDRGAGFVVLDSGCALAPAAPTNRHAEAEVRLFVYQLAGALASHQATTVLVGGYDAADRLAQPVFTCADVVVELHQVHEHSASVRELQVRKMRGQPARPGRHAMRITDQGVRVFPCVPLPVPNAPLSRLRQRLAVGIDDLDELLGGGLPAGDGVLIEGPSGTGKSILTTHFIAEGGHRGQPGVLVLAEERPERFVARAAALGLAFEPLVRDGLVEILSCAGRDLSAGELSDELLRAAERVGAARVAIDSLTGLEAVLSTRRGLEECVTRLVPALTGAGMTVWLTASPSTVAQADALRVLVDDVISLRQTELEGRLVTVLAVVKMRNSRHSTGLHVYEFARHGLRLAPDKIRGPQLLTTP